MHLPNDRDRIPITDAADLRLNILAGRCDEYLTLICEREPCVFIHEGLGEVMENEELGICRESGRAEAQRGCVQRGVNVLFYCNSVFML